jgi:hypothetical protein
VNYRKVLIVDVPVDVDEPAFAAAWNLVDAAGREKLQEADLVVVTQGHQSYVVKDRFGRARELTVDEVALLRFNEATETFAV